jgi:hypothetical protein
MMDITGYYLSAQAQSAQVAGGGAYTAVQVQLLASKGVSYNPATNTWGRVTPQGRGQYVETVNPDAVFKILIL